MRNLMFRVLCDGMWIYYRTGLHGRIDAAKADHKTEGQYTGVNDKYNHPVYEGDILEFFCELSAEPNRQVLFNDEFLTYTILSKQEKEWVNKGENHYKYCHQEDNEYLYFLNQLESYQFTIVGNIYESPEMLRH